MWGDEGLKTFDIFDGIQRQATTLCSGNRQVPLNLLLRQMYIIIMYTHIVTSG